MASVVAPSVTAWMEQLNYTVIDAYYYYERRMIEIARSLGRSVVAWQDIQGYNGSTTSLDVGEAVASASLCPNIKSLMTRRNVRCVAIIICCSSRRLVRDVQW